MRESKVNNFYWLCFLFGPVQNQHDILWFQVPVHDPDIMQMLDTQNQLSYYFCCHILLDCSILSDKLKQILSLHKFCNDVQMGFGLDTFFVENEQWVVKDAHDAAFVAELIKNTYMIKPFAYGSIYLFSMTFIAYYLLDFRYLHAYTIENFPVPIFWPISYWCWADTPLKNFSNSIHWLAVSSFFK